MSTEEYRQRSIKVEETTALQLERMGDNLDKALRLIEEIRDTITHVCEVALTAFMANLQKIEE